MEAYQEVIQNYQTSVFHTSHQKQLYLLESGEQKFEISEALYQLIQLLQKETSLEAVATSYSQIRGQLYQADDIDKFIRLRLMPLTQKPTSKKELRRMQRGKTPFLIHKDFLNAHKIAPITRLCAHLFRWEIALALVSISVLLQLFFVYLEPIQVQRNLLQLGVHSGLLMFFILSFSTVFHELGHSSACTHYGVHHGNIGIGLYLYFPVLYADVTEVWKLERGKRVIVDLSGIYFEFLYIILLLSIYAFTGWVEFKYCVYLSYISIFFNLNPFFKFDGYWLISDLLGVPNLRKRTFEMLSFLWAKLSFRSTVKTPFLFQMKFREKVFMGVYTVLTNIVLVYFMFRIPSMLYVLIGQYPNFLFKVIDSIVQNDWSNGHLYSQFIFQTILLITFSLIIFRLLKGPLLKLIQWYFPKKAH